MITREEFLEKCKNRHGDKYDYSLVNYKRVTDKVKIICPEHGVFEMEARAHYRGQGCPKCGIISRTKKKQDTTKTFIEKAKEVHGDNYDYSKVEYKSSKTKVCIICPEHGEFWQIPNGHLMGQGCPVCGKNSSNIKNSLGKEEFIRRSQIRHNYKYDYSAVEYVNQNTPVKIICPEHGEFWQKPQYHQNGSGCPKCAIIENAKNRKYTLEEFIEIANSVHGDKYDYSKSNYTGIYNKIIIKCPVHGEFEQRASDHICGCGCPKCGASLSKGEVEISEYIDSLNGMRVVKHDRSILGGNEIDILIPEKNVGIEFDGLFWHCEKNVDDPKYHLNKTERCKESGVQLIHIFEDEWNDKKEICKSRIKNILGVTENCVGARKCEIKKINAKTERSFLTENHIQGYAPSKYAYGLYYNNELMSIMTFSTKRKNLGSKSKEGEYELLRFCNKINWSVPGAASKLLKHFIKENKPNKIISYADKRWSVGNLYEKLGFVNTHDSKPNYFYLVNGERLNRFSFRKNVLVEKYGCPIEMSEHEFCLSQHWYRIYDCGTMVYEMHILKNEYE